MAVSTVAVHEANAAARTQWLKSRGDSVVRYWNNDVLGNLAGVVIDLEARLLHTPTPAVES